MVFYVYNESYYHSNYFDEALRRSRCHSVDGLSRVKEPLRADVFQHLQTPRTPNP